MKPCLGRWRTLSPALALAYWLDAARTFDTTRVCARSDDALVVEAKRSLDAAFLNTERPFCDMWREQLAPAFCTLRAKCEDESLQLSQDFAAIYFAQQILRNAHKGFK